MTWRSTLTAAVLICVIVSTSLATDWRWEKDLSFHYPNFDDEMRETMSEVGVYWRSFSYVDIEPDGKPEMLLILDEKILIAEMTGDFPNITWELKDDYFAGMNSLWVGDYITCASFYDFESDGVPEFVVSYVSFGWCMEYSYDVYEYIGDDENPEWEINWELRDLGLEDDIEIAYFGDWDGDRATELILLSEYRDLFWYETDDQDEWQDLGYEEIPFLPAVENIKPADFDADGDLDLLCMSIYPETYFDRSYIIFNDGTADEPQWRDPVLLDYYDLANSFPYDLNEDGYPDLIGRTGYALNSAAQDTVSFERPVYWALTDVSLAGDFVGDSFPEVIDHRWAMYSYDEVDHFIAQYQLNDGGWVDTQFWNSDYEDWVPDSDDVMHMDLVDFGDGQPRTLSFTTDEWHREDGMVWSAYCDMEPEDDSPVWQEWYGLFFQVFDEDAYNSIPILGDLSGDGVDDLLVAYNRTEESNTMIKGYITDFDEDNDHPVFMYQPDWSYNYGYRGNCNLFLADMDGDSDLDLVGTGILIENTGDAESPEWQRAEDPFREGGPEDALLRNVCDVNGDGRPDLITGWYFDHPQGNAVYLNNSVYSVNNETPDVPAEFAVNSIHPNPFNSMTTLNFSLPQAAEASITLFDLQGRTALSLELGQMPAGQHQQIIDAGLLPTGVYLLKLQAGAEVDMQKVALVR